MFVLNVRLTKRKIALAVVCLVVIILLGFCVFGRDNKAQNIDKAGVSCAEFLQNLGWQVPDQPIEQKEIQIPEEFMDVYENYNNLQREAGYDLKKYKGKKVTRYTFTITNFPGRSDVRANVLVFEDIIIGGDISSTELNGFMVALDTYENVVNKIKA
ncbi:MAG TPA: DUF4830 domain-containing protein [Clostridiales bacterium]|nr:DUF4830 domain-containing protein [Clostridiales bacterium]